MSSINLNRLGGSDAHSILHGYPRHPLEVYLRVRREMEVPEEERWEQMVGKVLEAPARTLFEEQQGVKVELSPSQEPKDRPWLRFSPDGTIPAWGCVWECKIHMSPRVRARYGDPGTAEVPPEYATQVQLYMDELDLDEAILTATFGFPPQANYVIPRDKSRGAQIQEALASFWERHVVPGVPPVLNLERAPQRALLELWSKTSGELVPATEATRADVELLRKFKAQMRAAEACTQELEGRIKAAIRDADGLDLGDGDKVTWKIQRGRRSGVEGAYKALADAVNLARMALQQGVPLLPEALPDPAQLLEELAPVGKTRVLRLK